MFPAKEFTFKQSLYLFLPLKIAASFEAPIDKFLLGGALFQLRLISLELLTISPDIIAFQLNTWP